MAAREPAVSRALGAQASRPPRALDFRQATIYDPGMKSATRTRSSKGSRTKARSGRRRRRARSQRAFPLHDMIAANAYGALRDESYGIIHRCVEELLRDPELRETIEFHGRKILRAIA